MSFYRNHKSKTVIETKSWIVTKMNSEVDSSVFCGTAWLKDLTEFCNVPDTAFKELWNTLEGKMHWTLKWHFYNLINYRECFKENGCESRSIRSCET